MDILEAIAIWRNQHKETKFLTEATMMAIERIEKKRIEDEAKYLPVRQYKINAVNIDSAREWLRERGKKLEVIKSVGMWAYVGLNAVEFGILKERHIEGVLVDPKQKPIDAPHDYLKDIIDFERIG